MLVVMTSIIASANEQGAKVVCGPYVQNVTETGYSVTWVTDIDAISWVETAPDDGCHFYGRNRTRHYDKRGYGVHPIGKIHRVTVEGLEPGKIYRYRIFNKGVLSFTGNSDIKYTKTTATDVWLGKPHKVRTLRKDYDTLRFDIYNDIHGKDSLLGVLMEGARKDLDFVVFNGDMTSNIENHEMIQSMYLATAAEKLKGSTPIVASRGNHELRGRDAVRWCDYFETPTGQTYYSLKMGDYLIIVLDGCEDKPDDSFEYNGTINTEYYMRSEETWLKEVIASDDFKSAKVRMVFCHIPPEKSGWFGNINVCDYFVSHLNGAGIDVMFCGHIHKWRVDEPGCGFSDADFPVICIPNIQRAEVTATESGIELDIFDTEGEKTHSWDYDYSHK